MSLFDLPVRKKFSSVDIFVECSVLRALANSFMLDDPEKSMKTRSEMEASLDEEDILGSLQSISNTRMKFDESYRKNHFTTDVSVTVYKVSKYRAEDAPVFAAILCDVMDHPRCADILASLGADDLAAIERYRDRITPEALEIVAEIDKALNC
ncbi:MAG: hypothetical protein CMF60_07195 [Magnetococcales bacterium]|nr:hypothetical protein [Magnetococcales bacterium]|tara:strand:- start:3761 stop:4219 length:459 start_codon:yes stop_codon:yes gene_type:complete